jgi:NADH/F420H2 dehydrogenase subunit C
MSIETAIRKLYERFPSAIQVVSEFRGETTVTIPRESLLDVARLLRADPALHFEMLLDVTALDWLPREPRFDVLYYFLSMKNNTRLRLRVQLSSDATSVPSLTAIYPGANFYEREVYDLFGITFLYHPFLRRLLLPDYVAGHPLRKDHPLGYEPVEFTHTYDEIQPDKPSAVAPPKPRRLIGSVGGTVTELPLTLGEPATPWSGTQSETLLINMGPHHPSTHGVLRVALEVDGEKIVSAMPDIGYLHTGIEKNAESKTYLKAIPLFDRMDYFATFFNDLAYCLAIEKLMEVEVPERAQIARVILCEIQRVQSHLVAVGSQAMDIGAVTVMTYAFREREAALDIFEMVAGARMMTSYFRFGGLAQDLPMGFSEAVRAFIKMIPPRLKEYDLARAHPRHRRVHRRASARARRDRADAARHRRELGPAKSIAVLGLRAVRFRRAGQHTRQSGHTRMLLCSDGRNPAIAAHRRASAGEIGKDEGAAVRHKQSQSGAAAETGIAEFDGVADPSFQVVDGRHHAAGRSRVRASGIAAR